MRTVILAGLAVLNLGAAPRPMDPPHQYETNWISGLCSAVRGGQSDRYQQKIEDAAGVTPSDSPELRRQKTADLFAHRMPTCDGADFSVSHGNILKYAVSVRTFDFINLAAYTFDADLNAVDSSDGRTVLDFVDDEISRNVGRPAEDELRYYRDFLVGAGARTTAQLQAGEDCRPSTRCRQ